MNMYYNQTCAAKGETNGNRQRPLFNRSMQRAAVNIFKTENSYELLVFDAAANNVSSTTNASGLYDYTGSPFVTWLIQNTNGAASSNQLQIAEVPVSPSTKQFAYCW